MTKVIGTIVCSFLSATVLVLLGCGGGGAGNAPALASAGGESAATRLVSGDQGGYCCSGDAAQAGTGGCGEAETEADAGHCMVNVSDSESAVAEESGGKKEEGADAPQPAPAPAAPSDAAPEKATINKAAPAFTLTDHTGKAHTLADYKGKTVVLEWINYDCPIVRKHYDGGNMQALQKKYTEKGVVWLCVNSSAKGKQGYFEGDKLKERIEKEKGSQTAYLLDTKGAVGRAYGAKATPHMYVITAEGVLVYMGAIDSIPSGKKEDIAKATNYVDAALTAVLAGKPVEKQVTEAYGCAVKY